MFIAVLNSHTERQDEKAAIIEKEETQWIVQIGKRASYINNLDKNSQHKK